MQLILSEVEVEALPMKLPHEISIDISTLVEDGQVIHLSDITLQDGVEFVDELTRTVVTTEAFKEEVEESDDVSDSNSDTAEAVEQGA